MSTAENSSFSVVVCSYKVERDIRLVADDPTVVRDGRYDKQISGFHFGEPAVCHRCHRLPGNNHSDMLDFAKRRVGKRADIFRPFPSPALSGVFNRHPANANDLEFAFVKNTDFVGRFKSFQHYFQYNLSIEPEFQVRSVPEIEKKLAGK